MSKNILIADSGSSKTQWALVCNDSCQDIIMTRGINPVRDDKVTILDTISKELLPNIQCDIDEIFFYGAGCVNPFKESLAEVLAETFPSSTIHVESDLLGAAIALCGHGEGIACILGTGSNSCYYDGKEIRNNVSPLGYILGDEGSGAVLGKTLVGDVLKGQLSPQICEEFMNHFHLTPAEIIQKVYREPMANKFLASLVPFLGMHRQDTGIHQLLVNSFRMFLRRNVRNYNKPHLPVNFVGGIAGTYQEELREAIDAEGMEMGKILLRPIDNMVKFHLN